MCNLLFMELKTYLYMNIYYLMKILKIIKFKVDLLN